MKRFLHSGYPLWVALLLYWLLTFGLLEVSLVRTGGHFGYPLDDTYIHMAMARHMAESGVWGLTRYAFSSSTSSPLWTALLAAAYKLFGVNDWTPFALSLLAGSLLLAIVNRVLRPVDNPARRSAYLILIVLFTPLPILALLGMEHILHALLSVCLIYLAVSFLERGKLETQELILLAAVSGLLTVTRYEGIFLVASVALLYVFSRRWVAALVVGGAGFATVAAYGAISLVHGWYFAPNSVLLKANGLSFTAEGLVIFLQQMPFNLAGAPYVLVLIMGCLGLYLLSRKQPTMGQHAKYLVAAFVPAALLHMQFGSLGQFFRYEAYLVVIGLVIVLDMGDAWMRNHATTQPWGSIFDRTAMAALCLLAVAPMVSRMYVALLSYPQAVLNIYEQQYQMGLFLRQYYAGRAIGLNDVGAVDYLADLRTLDLFGLGDMDVARAKLGNSLDRHTVERITSAHGAEVVFIYDQWFIGKIPPSWVRVGSWTIPDNVVCFDATVQIYAPGPEWESSAIANLREFSGSLPSDVQQSGKYTLP